MLITKNNFFNYNIINKSFNNYIKINKYMYLNLNWRIKINIINIKYKYIYYNNIKTTCINFFTKYTFNINYILIKSTTLIKFYYYICIYKNAYWFKIFNYLFLYTKFF